MTINTHFDVSDVVDFFSPDLQLDLTGEVKKIEVAIDEHETECTYFILVSSEEALRRGSKRAAGMHSLSDAHILEGLIKRKNN